MSDIIGDSITVLRVKVEVENGFDEVVAENIASLQGDVKSGMFDVNYPYSLVEYVKTNIPSSVVMNEVVIPEGQNSVSVTLKGAASGKGALYVNGLGFNEKVIPVEVVKSDEASASAMQDATSAINEINSKADKK